MINRDAEGRLHAGGVALEHLAATYGTPLYVYAADTIRANHRAFEDAFAGRRHRICYAVKANMNLSVLALFQALGAGFDVVSGGELGRVLRVGAEAGGIVFSGVGKSEGELRRALEAGVGIFNVESAQELDRLGRLAAQAGRTASIALRVNPDVDARTHPYISTGLRDNKFGVPATEARGLYARAAQTPGLRVRGVACHIGSQLTDLAPLGEAFDRIGELIGTLRADGHAIRHVDLGGGLGVRYRDEAVPDLDAYARLVRERFPDPDLELVFEPGRRLVADAGLLLTRVEYVKHNGPRAFAVIDAAMNDLLRPALYDAWHPLHVDREGPAAHRERETFDVVGPVCESGDFLARGRDLQVGPGDLLAVGMAGAYGFGMASNYNARDRAAEVMVQGGDHWLVRRRETLAEQMAPEWPPRCA